MFPWELFDFQHKSQPFITPCDGGSLISLAKQVTHGRAVYGCGARDGAPACRWHALRTAGSFQQEHASHRRRTREPPVSIFLIDHKLLLTGKNIRAVDTFCRDP
jgi:hypothetical protein